MNTWDENGLRCRFSTLRDDAERYCKEIKNGKVGRTDSYKAIHDEHWARWYVFDWLSCCAALRSQAQLQSELARMKDCKIELYGAFSPETCEKWRLNTIGQLIAEFS